ncbi:hypothetical protein K4H28_00725 [Deefgea tanakiae]|uniref:Uncharacterized protein n=1 Tax=Deefgea tanakiae TaxID=2865840 RepID=A0ABX8ZA22_9NEIS|nr:hypothetical protein [Deefgea tanakiae]QZA78000.1 hypothetical protein K4H28_00725 [Deefgea tanakiae]
MKLFLLALFLLVYTAVSAALLSNRPKMALHGNAAQAMCMAGDSARACWHNLEHRLN